jgi:hypothetical protein
MAGIEWIADMVVIYGNQPAVGQLGTVDVENRPPESSRS